MSLNTPSNKSKNSIIRIFIFLVLAFFCLCLVFGSWQIKTSNYVYSTGKYALNSKPSLCTVENHPDMKSGENYEHLISPNQCVIFQQSVEIGNYEENIPYVSSQVDISITNNPYTLETSEYIFNIKTPKETLDQNGNITITVTKK